MMMKPLPNEYQDFYANYVEKVNQTNGLDALQQTGNDLLHFLKSYPQSKGTHKYAPEKWSVNDLVQHIIDCELIFISRALRIARYDQTPLPGFEQDDFVREAKADYKNLGELILLFEQTRNLTCMLFNSFSDNETENIGHVNGGSVSVRALAFIISGHGQHHLEILKERY